MHRHLLLLLLLHIIIGYMDHTQLCSGLSTSSAFKDQFWWSSGVPAPKLGQLCARQTPCLLYLLLYLSLSSFPWLSTVAIDYCIDVNYCAPLLSTEVKRVHPSFTNTPGSSCSLALLRIACIILARPGSPIKCSVPRERNPDSSQA